MVQHSCGIPRRNRRQDSCRNSAHRAPSPAGTVVVTSGTVLLGGAEVLVGSVELEPACRRSCTVGGDFQLRLLEPVHAGLPGESVAERGCGVALAGGGGVVVEPVGGCGRQDTTTGRDAGVGDGVLLSTVRVMRTAGVGGRSRRPSSVPTVIASATMTTPATHAANSSR